MYLFGAEEGGRTSRDKGALTTCSHVFVLEIRTGAFWIVSMGYTISLYLQATCHHHFSEKDFPKENMTSSLEHVSS